MDDLTNEQKLLLTTMYRDYLELSKKSALRKQMLLEILMKSTINTSLIDRTVTFLHYVGHYIVKAILIAMVEITKLTKFQLPMIQSSTLKTNSKIILLKC